MESFSIDKSSWLNVKWDDVATESRETVRKLTVGDAYPTTNYPMAIFLSELSLFHFKLEKCVLFCKQLNYF